MEWGHFPPLRRAAFGLTEAWAIPPVAAVAVRGVLPAPMVPPMLCSSMDLEAQPKQGRLRGALHWKEESLS